MPRIFAKFKSNKDETEDAQVTPPVQSFRVLERHEVPPVEGAVRSPKGNAAQAASKPDSDDDDDNMFSGMKPHNRGSAISNTTHATYTDNSSRHSNASTAPSSADCKNAHDENRLASSKANSPEGTAKAGTSGRSIGSKILGRAGRTFSFGQKKHPGPLIKDDSVPGVPPLLNPNQASQEKTRGMTASSTGTAKQDAHHSEQSDKRANMATAKMEDVASPRGSAGGRQAHAGKRVSRGSDLDNPLNNWADLKAAVDRPDSPLFDLPPPIPPHQKPSYANPQTPRIAKNLDEDEDSSGGHHGSKKRQPGRNEYATGSPSARARRQGKQVATYDPVRDALDELHNSEDDESDGELFEGRPSRFARALKQNATPKAPELPEKIMTSEEYERYAAIKAREAPDDSSDEINYDDDEEDEAEKQKEITRQRRKQEASMAAYRQQQMKVTGTPHYQLPEHGSSGRPGLPSSMSAPQLSQVKGREPTAASDVDDDEDTPLAIIQAQAIANAAKKNKSSSRLNNTSSNPNIRASVNSTAMLRPTSIVGDPNASRRHSTLPAFARGLPQDPYAVPAAMGRPGGFRDSTSFNNDFIPASPGVAQSQGVGHHGGLIGVIDREEKAKALRRGSPSVDATRFMGGGGYLGTGGQRQGVEFMGGMQQQQMMYNHPGMAGSGMQGIPPGYMQQQQQYDQGHYQVPQTLMNPQRMSQYMQQQQQSQFMGMGHGGQGLNMPQQHFSHMQGNASAMNLGSNRASFAGDGPMDARRADYNMRTMSMVQPGSAPMIHPGYAGSVRSSVHGYAPSVAPSERSNVGLPSRYRAVSQAAATGGPSRSGGGERARSAMRVVNKPASVDDDDDEQGWEAMKASREKRMSVWKAKKSVSSIL